MSLKITDELTRAYKEDKIKHPSQAILYIDHVCSQCGHVWSYANWSSNGHMCIRCGNTDEE